MCKNVICWIKNSSNNKRNKSINSIKSIKETTYNLHRHKKEFTFLFYILFNYIILLLDVNII